jgi:hypothetical protein
MGDTYTTDSPSFPLVLQCEVCSPRVSLNNEFLIWELHETCLILTDKHFELARGAGGPEPLLNDELIYYGLGLLPALFHISTDLLSLFFSVKFGGYYGNCLDDPLLFLCICRSHFQLCIENLLFQFKHFFGLG